MCLLLNYLCALRRWYNITLRGVGEVIEESIEHEACSEGQAGEREDVSEADLNQSLSPGP